MQWRKSALEFKSRFDDKAASSGGGGTFAQSHKTLGNISSFPPKVKKRDGGAKLGCMHTKKRDFILRFAQSSSCKIEGRQRQKFEKLLCVLFMKFAFVANFYGSILPINFIWVKAHVESLLLSRAACL